MSQLLGSPLFTALDADAAVISGAVLYFYLTGTTSARDVYQESTLDTPFDQSSGIAADSAGRWPNIWLDPSIIYKMVIKDSATGSTIRTIDPVNSAALGAGDLTFIQLGTGATTSTVQDKLRESVSVKDFGAACDGTTDDTAAVQAAVTACVTNGSCALLVPGRCKLTASVNIDRLVDGTTEDFHIIGQGPKAGFYTTAAIKMFDTSLTYVADPQSERVVFNNIHFECDDAATAAYVMSQKFMRVEFRGCRFRRIKCVTSSNYLQSWYFRNCYATRHSGFFLYATTFVYDLNADIQMEGLGVEKGFYAGTFDGVEIAGIYEGILGPILEAPGCAGLKYRVRYSEGNINPDVSLGAGGGTSRGLHFEGGVIFTSTANNADSTFWPIILGDARGVSFSGIYTNGRLFNDSQVPFGEMSGQAYAVTALNKSGRPLQSLPGGGVPRTLGLTAHAGGGYLNATVLKDGLNTITTCATAADSVGLPYCSEDPTGSQTRVVIVKNNGAAACQVFVAAGDAANYGGATAIDGLNGYTTGVPLPPGATRVFYTTGLGVWVSFIGYPAGASAYTVANPATDRALDVTTDTVAQVAAVLGTLIADLKTAGLLV